MNEASYPVSPITTEEIVHREPLVPVKYIVVGVIVVLIVSTLFTSLLVYLALNYAATIIVVRDIFIITLGLCRAYQASSSSCY